MSRIDVDITVGLSGEAGCEPAAGRVESGSLEVSAVETGTDTVSGNAADADLETGSAGGADTLVGSAVDTDAQTGSEADAITGASPGTAQACNEFGLNDLESNLVRFGIKPPGQA